MRVLSPELVQPLLFFFLTDIPLLPGSPRRLSSRTVARGGQGPKQYLRVPSPRAPGQRDSSSGHSGQISRRECSHDNSVSTDGHLKGASHLAILSFEACCAYVKSPVFLVEHPYLPFLQAGCISQQPWLSLFSEGSGKEKVRGRWLLPVGLQAPRLSSHRPE